MTAPDAVLGSQKTGWDDDDLALFPGIQFCHELLSGIQDDERLMRRAPILRSTEPPMNR